MPGHPIHTTSTDSVRTVNQGYENGQNLQSFDPYSTFNPLPQYTPELTVPGWNPAYTSAQPQNPFAAFANTQNGMAMGDTNPASYPFPQGNGVNPADPNTDYLYSQYWDPALDSSFGSGLDQEQQQELMDKLESEDAMQGIQQMIGASEGFFTYHEIAKRPY